MKQNAIISGKNISIGYTKGRTQQSLYNDLDFNLFSGELTCLLGVNGAGKSTLLRSMSAMQPILGGDIFINNNNLNTYNEQELSQLLGLVLTDKTSVGGLTVREMVALGRYPYTGFWGTLSKEDNNIIDRSLSDVCICHKSACYMAELSDGERQKVMIAKALAQECPVIILDEPTAFLDVSSRIEIMGLLHLLAHKSGKAILMSTHDIEVALMLADRLWLLSEKTGLTCGVTEDIVLSDAMTNFFSTENIYFEKHSGRFRTQQTASKTAYLSADGELQYWTQNLLQRIGFRIVQESVGADIVLEVYSHNNIVLTKNGTRKIFTSFEFLVDFLLEDF